MVYTKEFLILELQRFYKENNRSPTQKEFKTSKLGYPTITPYYKHFDTWNNALKEAGLKINHDYTHYDGTEVCENCGEKRKNKAWQYKNDKRLCPSCYEKADYKYGNLDKNSNVGIGFIAEKIVLNTLDSEKHCNCEASFNHGFDIYDEFIYGKIDVKCSILGYSSGKSKKWHFKLVNKIKPEHYFMLAFSNNHKNIEHVWVIPSEAEILQNKKAISITNTQIGLSRVKEFEVSASTFNETYHSMSIDNCTVLRKS